MHKFLTLDDCKDLTNFTFHKLGHQELIGKVPIEFSTRMTTTMGLAYPGSFRIKLSRQLFDYASPGQRAQTVIHEACHIVQFIDHPRSEDHGEEWKALMIRMGLEPLVHHNVWLPKIKKGYVEVSCECTSCKMGPVRVKRMRAGKKYFCKNCLAPFKEEDKCLPKTTPSLIKR